MLAQTEAEASSARRPGRDWEVTVQLGRGPGSEPLLSPSLGPGPQKEPGEGRWVIDPSWQPAVLT